MFTLDYSCTILSLSHFSLFSREMIAGVVSKSAREIPEAGEAGPAEIDVPERDRRGKRGLEPRGWQREGGGPLPEKPGDAARQHQRRDVRERGETDP